MAKVKSSQGLAEAGRAALRPAHLAALLAALLAPLLAALLASLWASPAAMAGLLSLTGEAELRPAQAPARSPKNAPKSTPGIPPLRPPNQPPSQPLGVAPDNPPEGVMIVRPNPRAWQSLDGPTEIYFHRDDPVGWPGALTLFAKSVETRYYDWYAGSGYGALDDDLAWIFDELESRASQSLDLEEGDYGRLWTSESLMAFLAENLQALAVDTSGYWHYMPLGEDEDWRATGALYQNSFGYRVW